MGVGRSYLLLHKSLFRHNRRCELHAVLIGEEVNEKKIQECFTYSIDGMLEKLRVSKIKQ